MTAYVFGTTAPPSAIPKSIWGQVPPDRLDEVDDLHHGDVRYEMATLPAEGMRALHAIMKLKYGVILVSTGRYRTKAQQRTLWVERWSTVKQPNYYANVKGVRTPIYVTETFEGKTWWLKTGASRAAIPGTSPHESACADDTAEMINGKLESLRATTVEQMIKEAPSCGFAWAKSTKTPIEPWHLQWVMGDKVPPMVAYLRSLPPVGTPAPAPIPEQGVPNHGDRPWLALGSKDTPTNGLVTGVQLIMRDKCNQTFLKVTSVFDHDTLLAWQTVCTYFNAVSGLNKPVDGDIIGDDWDYLAIADGTWDRLYFCGFPRP